MAAAQARLDCVDSASVGVSRPLRSLCILAFALPSLTGAESSQSVLHLPTTLLPGGPKGAGSSQGLRASAQRQARGGRGAVGKVEYVWVFCLRRSQ